MERKLITLDDIERRFIIMHREAYYPWIRNLVTLASGSLTLLVGLQKHYLSGNPHDLWLLKSCWVGLAASICLGVVALYGEAQTPLDAVKKIRKERDLYGDAQTAALIEKSPGVLPKRGYRIAQRLVPALYCASLLCLCIYALVNI